MDPQEIEQELLKLLQNNGHKAFRPKEIARKLGLTDNRDYRRFRDVLARLESEDRIARIKGGRYTFARLPREATGILSVSPRGFGFVRLDEDQSEVFISSSSLLNALHGDRVAVRLLAPAEGDRKRAASVERVIERRCLQTVGTFEQYPSFGLVTSTDLRILPNIRVEPRHYAGAGPGDKVVVSIDRFDDPDAFPEGRILEVLGAEDAPGVADLALALGFGARVHFEPQVIAEAEQIDGTITTGHIANRLDLRDETVFTIDPEDAKDFDDAVHVRDLGGGQVEVGVHIADVSHYVHEGSAIDEEAFLRGTSIYMVERVFPMLPEHLSNEICTLAPQVERLTFSCIMRLNRDGKVLDSRITESVIRSRRRLTYEEAQRLIDGEEPDDEVAQAIRRAAGFAAGLTARRMAAGSVDFETPEVRVLLDEHGKPTAIIRKHRLAAHRLIEEFMLLANRTVSEVAASRVPEPGFVFRVHGDPDRDRIIALADYVRLFGMELDHRNGKVKSQALNALLDQARGTPQELVVEEAVLRSMAKAHYTPNNAGHFGLGFTHYCHFTSPIRRYPDLLVHRILKACLAGTVRPKEDTVTELSRRSDHCSEMERLADTIGRESIKLKQVEFLRDHIGEQSRGVVTGLANFGAFVELEEWLVEGLVHVRDMNDYYEYDERRLALIGSKGKVIRVGDLVEVVIAEADPETRRVDFVFAPGSGF